MYTSPAMIVVSTLTMLNLSNKGQSNDKCNTRDRTEVNCFSFTIHDLSTLNMLNCFSLFIHCCSSIFTKLKRYFWNKCFVVQTSKECLNRENNTTLGGGNHKTQK